MNTQHALPQNITRFDTPALSQPPFDQQTLTQGKTNFLFSGPIMGFLDETKMETEVLIFKKSLET